MEGGWTSDAFEKVLTEGIAVHAVGSDAEGYFRPGAGFISRVVPLYIVLSLNFLNDSLYFGFLRCLGLWSEFGLLTLDKVECSQLLGMWPEAICMDWDFGYKGWVQAHRERCHLVEKFLSDWVVSHEDLKGMVDHHAEYGFTPPS